MVALLGASLLLVVAPRTAGAARGFEARDTGYDHSRRNCTCEQEVGTDGQGSLT